MKKFTDEFFKPYVFATFLIILGSYLKVDKNLEAFTDFFAENSNSFLRFLGSQVAIWQIIACGAIGYFVSYLIKRLYKSKSKEERKMLRAISKAPREFGAEFSGNIKFLAKYKLAVLDQEYVFDKFALYCNNCSEDSQKMTRYGNDSFVCSVCGTDVNYTAYRNIKTAIINSVEKFEK